MIDAGQLMIHNYVKYGSGIYFIQDVSMFEGRYCSNLFDSMFSSFAKHHRVLIGDLDPIEITEEWLTSLGFKKWNFKRGNEITYSKGKLILHKRKRGWVINKNRKEPKYVHELQNIALSYYNIKLVNYG